VDFATISEWLGHAALITMDYARADLDLKRQH
jgi:hypothetical protein